MSHIHTDNLHFYGWNKIRESIQQLSVNLTIIDYVDSYFLHHRVQVIDYDWVGIVHHTASNFSDNNINNLFKNDIFLNSLKSCKALITLSEYNKDNINKELEKTYLQIPIFVLKHPTPPLESFSDKVFQLETFEKNLNVFNIGGWLRNPYTIYHTNIYYNNQLLNKIKLKGSSMDNYFPNRDVDYENIINKFYNNDFDDENLNINVDHILNYSHPNNSINYFIKYLIEFLKQLSQEIFDKNQLLKKVTDNHQSVQVCEYLENKVYLDVLVGNVVFCDYIDCSASNTIVECIATGTPIILNKLPSIVEYLGNDYPLYFEQIYNKEKNAYYLTTDNLQQAHAHLLAIKNLTLKTFTDQLQADIQTLFKTVKKKKKNTHLFRP